MELIRVASLFSGCGGTDLGIEGGFIFLNTQYPRMNTEVVYANDIDESACQIFNENFQVQCQLKDIREVKASEIPTHEILTGGFPCQSFSIVAQNPPRLGYKDDKGKLYQPATHIECAMKEAAKNFKVSGKRGATYSKLVASTLSVVPDAIPHKIQDYEIDSRPVVVQRARVTRYRPILKDWELDFILELPDDQLQVEVVKEILDYAGLYVGIGDFRPGKGGKFGKFMVTEFKAK